MVIDSSLNRYQLIYKHPGCMSPQKIVFPLAAIEFTIRLLKLEVDHEAPSLVDFFIEPETFGGVLEEIAAKTVFVLAVKEFIFAPVVD